MVCEWAVGSSWIPGNGSDSESAAETPRQRNHRTAAPPTTASGKRVIEEGGGKQMAGRGPGSRRSGTAKWKWTRTLGAAKRLNM